MNHSCLNVAIRFLLAGCLALGAVSGYAQSQASEMKSLKRDMEAVKKDLAEIKKTLGELRQMLAQRPGPAQAARQAPPEIAKVSVGKSPSIGDANAPVTLIEFSDFQCPFCGRAFSSTLPALKQDYIDTGKVRYVFRDFPLISIHPQARKAAEAAHCAGEQGKYWEMHDTLFKNQRALGVLQMKDYARTLGLDEDQFNSCLDEGKYAKVVDENMAAGSAVGVTGTPTFFVGKSNADGMIEGTRIIGAQSVVAFREAIDKLIDGQKTKTQ
jgi:protein-disulfide isomerase